MSSTRSVQVRGGGVAPAPDPQQALATGAELVWTALVDPTPAEVAAALAALGIAPALAAECGADVPEVPVPGEPARRRRPRVVEQGASRGVVLLSATYDERRHDVQLGVVTTLQQGPAVLTVSRAPTPDLTGLQASADREIAHVPLRVVALLLQGYEQVLEALDDDVAEIEQQVFQPGRGSYARDIYTLKRETLELQRAVVPLADLLERLEPPRSLTDRVRRASEHVDRIDSLLDSVLSADLSQVGVRQNEDQRRISAYAAIALVPTVVAGIYGMNFQHMPELSWKYGYPLALALILTVCAGLYAMFTRNGWLGPGSAERQSEDA